MPAKKTTIILALPIIKRQTWQLRLSAVDAPADHTGHEPAQVGVSAEQGSATVALAGVLPAVLVAGAQHSARNGHVLFCIPVGAHLMLHYRHLDFVYGRQVVGVVVVDLLAPTNYRAMCAYKKKSIRFSKSIQECFYQTSGMI